MSDKFYVGDYKNDGLHGENRGWIVGSYMANPARHSADVEVKYWEFPPGETDHPRKTSAIIECTFILTGVVRGEIDGEEITLRAGEYAVIQPNIPNNLVVEALEATSGLTVKAPSDPAAKTVIA